MADFEVIEIADDRNPYPALLRIDWATDMNGVINLKKWKMIFQNKSLRVVVPLGPTEGPLYTKLVQDYESDDYLDHIYKITARDQEWVNPATDKCIAWDCERSCTSNLDEELEH